MIAKPPLIIFMQCLQSNISNRALKKLTKKKKEKRKSINSKRTNVRGPREHISCARECHDSCVGLFFGERYGSLGFSPKNK